MNKVGVVTLAALVTVDALLVGLAVEHSTGAAEVSAADVGQELPPIEQPDGGTPPPEQPSSPSKSGPKPTSPASPGDLAVANRALVDGGDGRAVIRGTSGTCGRGGASVEMSLDGGETWTTTSADGIQVVLKVRSTDTDVAEVIGADRECERFTAYTTENGGGEWTEETADAEWFRLGAKGAEVHGNDGMVDVPCKAGDSVIDLATTSEDAEQVALCGDGTVYRSTDGGGDWSKRGSQKGAVTVDFSDADTGLLGATGVGGCAGIAVFGSEDGGESWDQQTCVESSSDGPPDLSLSGGEAYLVQGDAVWFSENDGKTWSERATG